MTDQKMIASMVGDFYGVYLGKSMLGIQGLLKKYHNHKFIITLISNLETTVEIDMHRRCMRFMISIRNIEEKGRERTANGNRSLKKPVRLAKNMKEMRGASNS